MIVELKTCVEKVGPNGEVLGEFDQWWLHVDGERLGIVPKREGGGVILTQRIDEHRAAAIRKEVEKQIGERSGVSMPPELPEEEDDDDDDA